MTIGAAGGAFLWNAVTSRYERTTGTLVGAALGASLGSQIDRNQLRCW